jgi:hypothetical protein
VLAGCGGSSSRVDSVCRAQAAKVAEHGGSMLLHYRGGTVYPADMSYLALVRSLDAYEQHDCPAEPVGRALRHRLSPAERARLLALLPRTTAARLRSALTAVR